MSVTSEFPESVVIALWLNSARKGLVSVTDAANAIETISGEMAIELKPMNQDRETKSWLSVVELTMGQSQPAAVAIPVDGDPAGVPAAVLAHMDRSAGAIAINAETILIRNKQNLWELVESVNTVIHYDINQTRRQLLEEIESSSKQLAGSELVGNEDDIVAALDAFRVLHVPAQLSKRNADAIELAARIKIVALGAITSTQAMHSPSLDQKRIQSLEKLASASRLVLQSVITN